MHLILGDDRTTRHAQENCFTLDIYKYMLGFFYSKFADIDFLIRVTQSFDFFFFFFFVWPSIRFYCIQLCNIKERVELAKLVVFIGSFATRLFRCTSMYSRAILTNPYGLFETYEYTWGCIYPILEVSTINSKKKQLASQEK